MCCLNGKHAKVVDIMQFNVFAALPSSLAIQIRNWHVVEFILMLFCIPACVSYFVLTVLLRFSSFCLHFIHVLQQVCFGVHQIVLLMSWVPSSIFLELYSQFPPYGIRAVCYVLFLSRFTLFVHPIFVYFLFFLLLPSSLPLIVSFLFILP